jgi:cytochrome c-type biogenesis protein
MIYANIPLALFAGLFSILSPCVLPLVPIVLDTAVAEHRLGPLALAAGLATSFTAIGLFVATIGYSIGLDGEFFKLAGSVFLVVAGFAVALPRFQTQLALAAAPLGNWTDRRFGNAAWGDCAGNSA